MIDSPASRLHPALAGLPPVCSVAEIRAIEARAFARQPPPPLMARAGRAGADHALRMLGTGTRVLVLAGGGNNGGDAFVVARHLKERWLDVDLVFTGTVDRLPADARDACERWRDMGGTLLPAIPDGRRWDLAVDGLLGIGLERPVEGPLATLVDRVNGLDVPVLALDVPSGLHAGTGRVLGTAIRASETVTFIAHKPGLLTLDGPDHAGIVHVADLDLEAADTAGASGRLLVTPILRKALPPRRANSHKGSYGTVVVLGGATGMTGAVVLAGRAALHLGAGRVILGFVGNDAPGLDPLQPELMLRRAADVVGTGEATCFVTGPGMGTSPEAAAVLAAVIDAPVPLVLDADALNLVAADPERAARIAGRRAGTLLTPHPAEAGRLLGRDTSRVQGDRIAHAIEIASQLNAGVVLKGAGSVCAFPDGQWFINPSGNPGMASAGMGDTLAGMLGALVGQGVPIPIALLLGVNLHGCAGDEAARRLGGPIGVTATAVSEIAPQLLNAAEP